MAGTREDSITPEIMAYYQAGRESQRLFSGLGQLELARTQELILRYAPPSPAVICDIGGGSGVYACWLAGLGYEVHLVDPVPLHLDQARQSCRSQPEHPLTSLAIGDARELDRTDASVDVALLFGPLYHLTGRQDRLAALREARRILRVGGLLFAASISRFASSLVGLLRGFLDDPEFVSIVLQDLRDGQHRNPQGLPSYFTTAYFHHPGELGTEMAEAGLVHEGTLAIEGVGSVLQNLEEHWRDPERRQRLLEAIRWLEKEPSLIGISAHIMAIGRKES